MSTLEQQCEEIRKQYEGIEFDWPSNSTDRSLPPERAMARREFPSQVEAVWHVSVLLKQLDDLRSTLACRDNDVLSLTIQRDQLMRPVDAKEIALIQAKREGNLAGMKDVRPVWADIDVLLHALAESQRTLKQWIEAKPAQMSGPLGLQPVNSEGMRLYVDALVESQRLLQESQRECARLKAENLAQTGRGDSYCDRNSKLAEKLDQLEQENAARVERIFALEAKCALHAASEAQFDRRIERLEAALRRIDAMNDNPASYRSDINAVVRGALVVTASVCEDGQSRLADGQKCNCSPGLCGKQHGGDSGMICRQNSGEAE